MKTNFFEQACRKNKTTDTACLDRKQQQKKNIVLSDYIRAGAFFLTISTFDTLFMHFCTPSSTFPVYTFGHPTNKPEGVFNIQIIACCSPIGNKSTATERRSFDQLSFL